MLTFFKKLFGQSTARTKATQSKTTMPFEPSATMPSVEVAHLSLEAILGRFPEELKSLVLRQPEASATVALPIATIVKQLPAGVVKVSLATVHRQAPVGLFGPLPSGDKRMVEVPLAEVFRHVKPTMFKRRSDQRPAAAPDNKFNLFGDSENPYQIAPTAPEDDSDANESAGAQPPRFAPSAPGGGAVLEFKLARDPEPEPEPVAPRVISPPADFFEPKLNRLPATAPTAEVAPAPAPVTPPAPAPKLAFAPEPPPVSAPPPSANEGPSITVPVEPLCAGWPEPIRQELAVLNGSARVSLPTDAVTAGLARGKVSFTWGEIRSWLEPALGESGADAATELTLPLKVVAPVFLGATRKTKVEPQPEIDAEIPTLFTDSRIEPSLESTAVPVDGIAEPEPALAPEALSAENVTAEAVPEEVQGAAEPAAAEAPATIGRLFGEPERTEWTPAEIVANLAKLHGISGAVVALQEGLLVAHSMPRDVKSEVIAAFLPQLFARLNQYAGEMKLGDVDDLLFTTHGAHCQIYRLGFIYFAVLGKPGEPLPTSELRLVADELARQAQKS
jgi:predicted regulator of Ras-like GTPase activity (Roadblock/LC7/MglB family)